MDGNTGITLLPLKSFTRKFGNSKLWRSVAKHTNSYESVEVGAVLFVLI